MGKVILPILTLKIEFVCTSPKYRFPSMTNTQPLISCHTDPKLNLPVAGTATTVVTTAWVLLQNKVQAFNIFLWNYL